MDLRDVQRMNDGIHKIAGALERLAAAVEQSNKPIGHQIVRTPNTKQDFIEYLGKPPVDTDENNKETT